MLLTIRSYVEGGRALAAWIGKEIDVSHKHPDAEERAAADDLVALMTPIVKAFLTDIGYESATLGQQVYGGHGYIREHGMEQLVRDARITQIYEGTNGIQALDLVGRKLSANMGRYLRRYFHPVGEYLTAAAAKPELKDIAGPVLKSFGQLHIGQKGMANPDEAAAAATDYLRMFALTTLGYLWTRMAEVSLAKLESDDKAYYQAKLDNRALLRRPPAAPRLGPCARHPGRGQADHGDGGSGVLIEKSLSAHWAERDLG